MTLHRPWMTALLIVMLCFVFRGMLERHPVTHIVVQLSALVVAGWLAGQSLGGALPALRLTDWNAGGSVGILVALFAGAFWMLPRNIDWALGQTSGEFAKFVSIPLLMGVSLALSWSRAPALAKCLIKANAVSMLLSLSWVYTTAPERLCNNYLLGQQQELGSVLLWLAIVISVIWSVPLFVSQPLAKHRPANIQTARGVST
ncbi:MAG: hypothetical protein EPO23_08795 [Xanthobacteraceae bacterium]|nr:MAG: hypothetical protein EPO23_08795 [Xanthobacteraceae bacterium]